MVHKEMYKLSCLKVKDLISKAKTSFFINKLEECNGDQKKLFQVVDSLLARGKSSSLPSFTCPLTLAEAFNDFFISKISDIRQQLQSLQTTTSTLSFSLNSELLPASGTLDKLTPSSESEILKIIKNSSKVSCQLDPIPSSLLIQLLPQLVPIIKDIVNLSLSSGQFPSQLKSAIVQPLLKKSTLDPEIYKNFRPVSNLSYISKVIEKVIAARLLQHMQEYGMLDKMQSAYRSGHSTETALLRVQNDVVRSVDKGQGVFLILLDLSAAFDTVDHGILLSFLEHHVGVKGTALDLFRSYLTCRTQCVAIESTLSELCELEYGVPQGSVLGPIKFCTYTLPLGAILRHHKVEYHIYADDTQLYCSFDMSSQVSVLERLAFCIKDIRSWMIQNKLKINEDKTEFLVIASPHSKIARDIQLEIAQSTILPSKSCRNLGVIFDSHMSMDAHVKNICRNTHFHLRNIGAIRQLLPVSGAEQLMHALVTSRLDYCNSLLYGLPDNKIKRLQRIQNIAARIVSLSPKSSHITPILHDLHWLPVKQRIVFKILLLTYRSIHGSAPEYLSELVTVYQQSRSLRSASQLLLSVPKTRLKSYGDRCFAAAAPREWNKLPLHVRLSPSLDSFKTRLKTFLFKQCYE